MKEKKTRKKVYNTWYSQAVTHPSTNQARRCLTSVIGREPVFSTWYGRRHFLTNHKAFYAWNMHNKYIICSKLLVHDWKLNF